MKINLSYENRRYDIAVAPVKICLDNDLFRCSMMRGFIILLQLEIIDLFKFFVHCWHADSLKNTSRRIKVMHLDDEI